MEEKKINTTERIMEGKNLLIGSKKVSSVLTRFLVSKPRKIIENLKVTDKDPMDFYEKHVEKFVNKFKIKEINMSELRIAISSIKKTKSTDYYNLSMIMIIKIRKSIEPILLNLVNQSIKQNIFPDLLKISKVIPIPKGNDFIELENYRGINIFSPISKVIEKVWAIQINKYLKENNLLTQQHQGGIKNRGTTLATLNISMKINDIIEGKHMAAIICLDQSACFDIINHEILIKKTQTYWFQQ